MNTKKKLVFATNNPNKLREARQILGDKYEIVSLAELGCHDDIPETADTLAGNALIKARYVHDRYGCDCFADDTGLSVDALKGAPGVYSARFAGEHCSPADNVAKLLACLQGATDRNAHFSTVIALIHDNAEHLFEGRVEGLIAEKEEGDGGFGYDPVFIEKESGQSFATMTPEQKNAVSHRGRAMQKLTSFLKTLVIMLVMLTGWASDASAQEWRVHPSYDGQMENMIVTPDYVFFLGTAQEYRRGNAATATLYGTLFRYDVKNEEMEYLNGTNYLGGNIVKAIAYNFEKRYLAVALEGGAITLLYDNGESKFIPGLAIADSSLDKTVNDITFDYASDKMYVATNFGYIVINDKINEIETSKILNKEIITCASFKDKIWLGTTDGLFFGEMNAFSFSDFSQVEGLTKIVRLRVLDDETLFVYIGDSWNQILGVISANGAYRDLIGGGVNGAFFSKDNCVAVTKENVSIFDAKADAKKYSVPPGYESSVAASYNGSLFWFSSGREGISCLSAPTGTDGKWTVKIDRFLPDASNAFMSMSMIYHPDYGMLVRNHGYEAAFKAITSSYDVISAYRNMSWTPISTTYRVKDGLLIDNPWGMAIDPANSDHLYCGSERSGLFRLDLKNPENSMQFAKPKDIFGNENRNGYVKVFPDNPVGTWSAQCVVSRPMFDNAGNLWMAYVDPEAGGKECVSSKTVLLAWSPEARRSTVSAATYKPWDRIEIPDVNTDNVPKLLVLTRSAAKNIVLVYGNTNVTPLVVLDHGGTPSNTADDKMVKLKTIYDQDGESLLLNRIYDWYEDPTTGLVWVAYNDGIFTFDPVEALNNSVSVRRIKVPRNDGTNLADYLLDKVQINSISVDGNGRKWFGTQGAGLVCTSADGRTIYNTYTPDNSLLPGSSVYAATYNPSSKSMMISTDGGLCELFLSGTSSEGGASDVRCFPNPVRPGYYGIVTIDGLEEDAMVKIVDTAGNLVKECGQAHNGTATWDVTNQFMKKVPGGIYFVVASSGPSSDNYDRIGKILVVD